MRVCYLTTRVKSLKEKTIESGCRGDVRKQVSVAKEIARRFLNAAESDDQMDICGIMYTKADIPNPGATKDNWTC